MRSHSPSSAVRKLGRFATGVFGIFIERLWEEQSQDGAVVGKHHSHLLVWQSGELFGPFCSLPSGLSLSSLGQKNLTVLSHPSQTQGKLLRSLCSSGVCAPLGSVLLWGLCTVHLCCLGKETPQPRDVSQAQRALPFAFSSDPGSVPF